MREALQLTHNALKETAMCVCTHSLDKRPAGKRNFALSILGYLPRIRKLRGFSLKKNVVILRKWCKKGKAYFSLWRNPNLNSHRRQPLSMNRNKIQENAASLCLLSIDCQQHKMYKNKADVSFQCCCCEKFWVCKVLAFNVGNRCSSRVIWHITSVQSKASRVITTTKQRQKLYT